MESGPRNTFSAQNKKKTKSFMIFDPKKGGVHFFDIFDLPPPPPPLNSLKSSKKWVSSGGGLGGSGPKTHWGLRLLDRTVILQGVKLTIQPLGGIGPKRPKRGGGMWRFPLYPGLRGFYLPTSAR